MDLCEPLNRAHSNQRKAERALRSGDISGAIKNFFTAAENFNAAETNLIGKTRRLTLDSDVHLLEALSYQRQFCLRQIDLLKAKLEQLQRQWKELMEQQKNFASLSNLDFEVARSEAAALGLFTDDDCIDTNELKHRVLAKIDEQDSLLEILAGDEKSTVDAPDEMTASKCPKTEKTVIEELRQCNEALRQFIVILLTELEAKKQEIEKLREEMRHLRPSSTFHAAGSSRPKEPGRNFPEMESQKLPELPPLELPSVRSLPKHEIL